jgi:hypothetical protein
VRAGMIGWMAAGAALLTCSATVAADTDTVAKFRIGGADYEMPLPSGYCLPNGKFAEIAQLMAGTDAGNDTLVTAYQCAKGAITTAEYPILIKSPKAMLQTSIGRKDLLGQLGPAFENPNLSALIAGTSDAANSKSLSEALGADVKAKTEVAPVGRDDTCGYLGGVVSLTNADRVVAASAVACITAVQNHVVLVYLYGPAENGTVGKLVPRAKALAQTLIARNEKP